MKIHFKILLTQILMLLFVSPSFAGTNFTANNEYCTDNANKDSGSVELSASNIAPFSTTATGNFSNPAVWVGGVAPPSDGTADITIAHDLDMDIDFIANNLTVQANITLTINPGIVLEVTGNITNNGLIYFESDGVNGSAQFDTFNGTISGSGEVTVERYVPARFGNRYLTSPVTTTLSIKENWQEGVNNTGTSFPADNINPNPGFGTHISGSDTSKGLDLRTSGFVGMKYYNVQGNLIDIDNTDESILRSGEAFFLLFRGDRSVNVNNNTSVPVTSSRLRSTGALHTGSRSYNVGNPTDYLELSASSGGLRLIGNPYQSVVDYTKVSRDDLCNYIYFRDIDLGGPNGRGGVIPVDTPLNPNEATAPSPWSSEINHYIEPGTAFFVRNLESGSDAVTVPFSPELIFEEDDKVTDISGSSNPNIYQNFYINSRVYKTTDYQNGESELEALGLRFSDDYETLPSTSEDAENFGFNIAIYYAVNNGLGWAIDKQEIPNIGDEVDFYIFYFLNGVTNYSLIFNLGNKPATLSVFLKDNFLNSETEITENFVYDFTIDSGNTATTASDRFSLVFKEPANRYAWKAGFDDNFNNTRVFDDAPFGNIKTLTVQATADGDTVNDNQYYIYEREGNDEWQNGSTPLDSEFTLFHGDSASPNGIMSPDAATPENYYTVQINDYDLSSRDAVMMETDNPPIDFAASNPVAQSSNNVYNAQNLELTINLLGNKSPQEKAFVRYTTDGFTTSDVIEVTFSTSSLGTATIPDSVNTAGATISYYVYTTTVDIAALTNPNHDLFTLKQANNGGANYSYTVEAAWTTAADFDFNNPLAWDANQIPPANQDIIIQDNVIQNIDYIANSVVVDPGGNLSSGGQNLTILDGGTITNNGTFNMTDGTVAFDGDGTVTGTVTFNDVVLNSSTIGVDFNTQSTINGMLTINSGAFVNTGSPIYGNNSTLIYNTTGTFGRTSEWSNAGLQGRPHHVIVQNNTTLDFSNDTSMLNIAAVIDGDLTIQSGSALYMDFGGNNMQAPLIVGGSFINNGIISLSNLENGDLKVEGDFTDNGTINYKQRALFFEGGNTQQITTTDNPYTIDVVRVNKSGGEVVMNQDLIIDKTGDPLDMSLQSVLDLNGYDLTLGQSGIASNVTLTDNAVFRSSATSAMNLLGNGNMGNITFDDSTNGITNILRSLILERESGDAGLSNTLYLKEGITLTSGTLNSNGNLVFLSDDTQTAVVRGAGVGNFNGTINGDVVVHRRFPLTGLQRSFRYISSSVNTASSTKPFIHENWQEGASNAMTGDPYTDPDFNPNPGFGTHITGAPGTIGQVSADGLDETATGNNSLFTWDDSGQAWSTITNTKTQTIDLGSTYALMVRGDRSAPLNSNTAEGDIPATLRTTGTLDLTDFTYNFSAPYNAMDPNEFVLVGNPYQAQVNMISVLADLGTIGIDPNYLWVWDPTLTDKGAYAVVDLNNPANPPDIGSLPGSSDANQYLQPFQAAFVQVDAGPSQTVQFQRDDIDNSAPQTTVFSTTNTSKIEIELYNSPNSLLLDAARLQIDPAYSNAKTFEDAAKFWNNDEYLAIINSNSYLSIDKRDLPQVNDTIPLLLGNYQSNQYTLQLESTLDANIQAQLYDHYLDQSLDLVNGNNTYDFSIDTSIPESTDNQRFELIFNPETLSTEDPLNSTFFKVYPNPTEDMLYIQSSGELLGQDVEMTCFDQLGRLVLSQSISNLEANTSLDLSRLSAGLYLLKLETEGHQETFKIQVK